MNDAKKSDMKKTDVTTGVMDKLLMWGSFALFVAFEVGLVWGFLKLCGRI